MTTVSYSNVQGGWPGESNIDLDPLFVDIDGADDIIGTDDDDLRLLLASPCIDSASDVAVPPDTADLDEDGDTTEATPLDLDGNRRFVDDPNTDDCPEPGAECGTAPIVDMGPYEFQGTYPACQTDADCADGLFCNGPEICVGGNCVAGSAPCDGQALLCNESYDVCCECDVCTQDADCDGVADRADNCPLTPNGPDLGSCGAGACSVAAAISGQAGRGRIAYVVSAGNIDTAKLITILRGDIPYPAQADTPAPKVTLNLNSDKIFFCCSSNGSEVD